MSTLRESIVLPSVFLSVALLGGLRVGADVQFVAPSLSALVLAMLLLGAMARASVFQPHTLMHSGRAPLENASGLVVLFTLFAASTQIFNLLTPDRGVLHAIFSIFFGVQLLTTIAGARDRLATLRSLVVLFGAVFVLRFLILESLYASDSTFLARVVTAAAKGMTLGGLDYQPNGAATGYIAFVTLTIYAAGLVLLGPSGSRQRLQSTATDVVVDRSPER
jgi:hypothetical protein